MKGSIMNLRMNSVSGAAAWAVLAAGVANAELRPTGLRCEYRRDPAGIDETKPRLSWQLESSNPAARRPTDCWPNGRAFHPSRWSGSTSASSPTGRNVSADAGLGDAGAGPAQLALKSE